MTKLNQTGIQDSFTDLDDIRKDIVNIHRHKDFFEQEIRPEDAIIHMDNAYSWAKRRCYAQRRKVGAIIVKKNRAITSGFNGTKSGHPNVCEKDGVTLAGVTHAEKNALFKLMEDNTDSPNNGAIFVTTAPCDACADDLMLAKISAVYFTELYRGVHGLEELIKNGISVYHVNMKMIEDFDAMTEESGEFKYNQVPLDFLTTIYKSTQDNDIEVKIEGIKKVRELFSSYEDGKYHKRFYKVSL